MANKEREREKKMTTTAREKRRRRERRSCTRKHTHTSKNGTRDEVREKWWLNNEQKFHKNSLVEARRKGEKGKTNQRFRCFIQMLWSNLSQSYLLFMLWLSLWLTCLHIECMMWRIDNTIGSRMTIRNL